MDFDDPDMVWETRLVGRPVGTHFSAGDSSPLARSDETNLLTAQAVLGPPVEKDGDAEEGSDLVKWAVVFAVGALLSAGAIKAVPRIINWRRDRRTPAQEPADSSRAGDDVVAPAASVASSLAASSATLASEVEVALEENRRSMSSAEVQRRLLTILIAAAIIADQVRALTNVRIEDETAAELQETMDKLTTSHLTDSLNRALEADASVLDDETAAALMEAFGAGQLVEGQFVPLRNEKLREALRLTRPEEASPDRER